MLFPCLATAAEAQTGPPNGGAEYGAKEKPPAPAPAPAQPGGAQPGQPGTAPLPGSPNPVVPGVKAMLLPDGTAAAPAAAPLPVQQAVWAANRIQTKPYRYGGGHARFPEDSGYDCSGTISYALHGAGLLKTPLDSSSFMAWGQGGRGAWITVYTNPGHAYVVIAGLRLDTSAAYVRSARRTRRSVRAAERGPRWRPSARPSRGFRARHPLGL
ncbi:MAG: hypothetical protein M3P50_10595 [Actinomycetota bacterium]|nr:hypothetical protein [Actinomycetota bacterium]